MFIFHYATFVHKSRRLTAEENTFGITSPEIDQYYLSKIIKSVLEVYGQRL